MTRSPACCSVLPLQDRTPLNTVCGSLDADHHSATDMTYPEERDDANQNDYPTDRGDSVPASGPAIAEDDRASSVEKVPGRKGKHGLDERQYA